MGKILVSFLLLLAWASLACRDSTTACPLNLGFQYTPADTTIHVGQSYTTSVKLIVGCGSDYDTFTWESSNPSVARVDPMGVVTGIGPGQATITAIGQKYGAVAGAHVTVAA